MTEPRLAHTQAWSWRMRLEWKNCTSPSFRLRLRTNRKQTSTSSVGSGNPAPITRIQPLIGGEMNSFSAPDIPLAREHGLALCIPRADCTFERLRVFIASQQL